MQSKSHVSPLWKAFTSAIPALLLIIFPVFSQAQKAKDTVKVGLFLENIYDIDFTDQSFKASFWIWFNYKNKELNFPKGIEFIKCKEFNIDYEDQGKVGDTYWCERKVSGEFVKRFSIKRFPFDDQVLEIETEIIDWDTSRIHLILDEAKSGVDSTLIRISDWNEKEYRFKKDVNSYFTSFGYPDQRVNAFHSVSILMTIGRDFESLFIKLFLGVFIAALIGLSSLFINHEHSDPRYSLPVGALFAAIGNKYIVDSIIPQTTDLTLVDRVHFLTFFLMFAVIVLSLISHRLYFTGKKELSKTMDLYSFWIVLYLYVITIAVFVLID